MKGHRYCLYAGLPIAVLLLSTVALAQQLAPTFQFHALPRSANTAATAIEQLESARAPFQDAASLVDDAFSMHSVLDFSADDGAGLYAGRFSASDSNPFGSELSRLPGSFPESVGDLALPQSTDRPFDAGIPAGSTITIRTIDAIDSRKAHPGQTFKASLDEPLVLNDGQKIGVNGADVLLKIVNVQQSGKLTGRAELTIAVDSLVVHGNRVPVVSAALESASTSRGKKSAKVIAGGAVLGAALGMVFGGGRGAAAGAQAGAGAGAAVQLLTKGQHVVIPAETRLTFTVGSGAK